MIIWAFIFLLSANVLVGAQEAPGASESSSKHIIILKKKDSSSDTIASESRLESRKRRFDDAHIEDSSHDQNLQNEKMTQAKRMKADKPAQASELFRFIHDSYTQRRGNPAMYEIFCRDCRKSLMYYQKDGPGRLLRCYLDRIRAPQDLVDRQKEKFSVSESRRLRCKDCETIIGWPMIYKSENRPAYNMDQGKFYFNDITSRVTKKAKDE
jgi:hypothetical protein